ncbi:hypothetical protein NDU88_001410 [Pleurodeles waltl]|uniref:Uncharacterized protein n=1 Tax=Pleurodeles waltl TaxID=8319 RepID=A0AAV7LXU5_PLEWA|nr:hypothetical protein NDU88_001410 [Pleurodeles waltl]
MKRIMQDATSKSPVFGKALKTLKSKNLTPAKGRPRSISVSQDPLECISGDPERAQEATDSYTTLKSVCQSNPTEVRQLIAASPPQQLSETLAQALSGDMSNLILSKSQGTSAPSRNILLPEDMPSMAADHCKAKPPYPLFSSSNTKGDEKERDTNRAWANKAAIDQVRATRTMYLRSVGFGSGSSI